METFVVKDSGQRQDFITGARRDIQEGKGDFSLIPFEPLVRVAELYRKGAAKYGSNNWRKGIPLSRWISSLRRHAIQAGQPEGDVEDHFAATVFNAFGYMYTEAMIASGKLPRELDDIGRFSETASVEDTGAKERAGIIALFNRSEGYETQPEPPKAGSSGESKAGLQATATRPILPGDCGEGQAVSADGRPIC